jgi:hypothetical protein
MRQQLYSDSNRIVAVEVIVVVRVNGVPVQHVSGAYREKEKVPETNACYDVVVLKLMSY